MSFNFSTGARKAKLAALKAALDGGKIYIYGAGGGVPANAEDAISSPALLATITESNDGSTGLTFNTPVGGVMTKTTAESWKGTITTSGTAAFYRFCPSGDTPANASSTAVRLQGTCGLGGADLNLETITLVANGTNTVGADGYQVLED